MRFSHPMIALSAMILASCQINAGPYLSPDPAESETARACSEIYQLDQGQGELENPLHVAAEFGAQTAEDWLGFREHLKALFETHQYGSLPPRPDEVTVKLLSERQDEAFGEHIRDYVIQMSQAGADMALHFRLAMPLNNPGDVTVVIRYGDGGGPGELPSWWPEKTETDPYIQRGIATASFLFTDVAADDKDTYRSSGLYELFGDDIDTGVLMAWAWGMHRIVDALQDIDGINADQIIVTGHSRNGKAALIAGAFDSRIALTAPQHSGAGGAAPYSLIFGEAEKLENIAGFAPHWFRPGFYDYADKVSELAVDQHLLKALVAPRGLFTTEGTEDSWTNPKGAYVTHLAAKDVYAFLGAPEKIETRYRPTGHIPSHADVADFANHLFLGESLPEATPSTPYAFGASPYPDLTASCEP